MGKNKDQGNFLKGIDIWSGKSRVSVQGVESLWGDCTFIPADWGSQ